MNNDTQDRYNPEVKFDELPVSDRNLLLTTLAEFIRQGAGDQRTLNKALRLHFNLTRSSIFITPRT